MFGYKQINRQTDKHSIYMKVWLPLRYNQPTNSAVIRRITAPTPIPTILFKFLFSKLTGSGNTAVFAQGITTAFPFSSFIWGLTVAGVRVDGLGGLIVVVVVVVVVVIGQSRCGKTIRLFIKPYSLIYP